MLFIKEIKYFFFQTVVSYVRFQLMNLEQLLKIVRPCAILDPDRLLDAIEEKTTSKNFRYRGALCKSLFKKYSYLTGNSNVPSEREEEPNFLIKYEFVFEFLGPEENVASSKFNSKTIRGELRSALLDGDVTNYDMEKGNFLIF